MIKLDNHESVAITAIVVAKNESKMIVNCLDTLTWCHDVLVIDNGSSDDTASIAEGAGARVVSFTHESMAKVRNEALKKVKTQWLFYIDADERVTPTLAKEIMVHLETSDAVALTIHRQNIHYGKIMQHGGWQYDDVTRVFDKNKFIKWYGKIHESPKYDGKTIVLNSPLIHLTHRNTVDGLKKTIIWTKIEAQLLATAQLRQINFFTIFRKGLVEFIRRAIFFRGYKDGREGWIEAIVQGINKILIYIQVWENQRQPSLDDTYQKIEERIVGMWQSKV